LFRALFTRAGGGSFVEALTFSKSFCRLPLP
jgi:hypothetical protein